MKIAFLVGRFPWLSATFILNQITGMIDRGHEVTIFAEQGQGEALSHESVAERKLMAYRIEALPAHPLQRLFQFPSVWEWDREHFRALDVFRYGLQSASLRLLWGVHLFHGRRDFDVIQCHFGALGLKAVLLRRAGAVRGAIVTAFHGEDIVCYPRRFRHNIYKPLFAEGDLFLPISNRWNPELIAMGCPPERIKRHPMGVAPAQFRDIGRRKDLGPFRILTIARLVESKGIEYAIRAIASMQVPVEYVVAGDGPLRTNLEQLARTLGVTNRVHFQGECTERQAISLLSDADLFLLPCVATEEGDQEGMPVAIMEAMASGLPVVSTFNSAIPELVVDGVSGYLAAERDFGSLAAAMTRLAGDATLRYRTGEAGRSIVEEGFNIHRLNGQLEEHYASAVRL